jgi:hypothetical protein
VLHRRGVDAADGAVEVHTPEDLDPRHQLADEEREARRGLVVVLEDDGTHAAGAGQHRHVHGVHRARPIVWQPMHVDVDGSRQRARDLSGHGRLTGRRGLRRHHRRPQQPQDKGPDTYHRDQLHHGLLWTWDLGLEPWLAPITATAPEAP